VFVFFDFLELFSPLLFGCLVDLCECFLVNLDMTNKTRPSSELTSRQFDSPEVHLERGGGVRASEKVNERKRKRKRERERDDGSRWRERGRRGGRERKREKMKERKRVGE